MMVGTITHEPRCREGCELVDDVGRLQSEVASEHNHGHHDDASGEDLGAVVKRTPGSKVPGR